MFSLTGRLLTVAAIVGAYLCVRNFLRKHYFNDPNDDKFVNALCWLISVPVTILCFMLLSAVIGVGLWVVTGK